MSVTASRLDELESADENAEVICPFCGEEDFDKDQEQQDGGAE